MKIIVASNSFYSRQDKINFILNNFSLNKTTNLDIYEDMALIKNLLRFSLLQEPILYVVDLSNINKINDKDLNFLIEKKTNNYICFTTLQTSLKSINKIRNCCEFEYINQINTFKEKTNYIITSCANINVNINYDEVVHILNLCAGDVDLAINELKKLYVYYDNEQITKGKINLFVVDKRTDSFFDFYALIWTDNNYHKLKLINAFIDNNMIIPLFNGVKNYVYLAYQIKIMLNRNMTINQIAQQLKKHEFYVKNISDQIRNVNLSRIEAFNDKLIIIDLGLNTDKFKLKKLMYNLV